ncbi:permease [Citrobacter freundii]
MMVFLFSSPLLNPIVVGLLVATFGWTLTAIYVLAALVVAVGAGWLLHTLGFERYVRRTATQESSGCSSSASPCRGPLGKGKITYYKGFPEQSTPVFNFCLFINEGQGIRLRYYKRSR